MRWYEDKTYHLMCEKAIEIQELWEMIEGDYYVNPRYGRHVVLSNPIILKDNRFWLPRQDQLQRMIHLFEKDGEGCRWLVHKFKKFLEESDLEYVYTIEGSMEQLWLAFVMYENYQKVWKGNKWEVQNG